MMGSGGPPGKVPHSIVDAGVDVATTRLLPVEKIIGVGVDRSPDNSPSLLSSQAILDLDLESEQDPSRSKIVSNCKNFAHLTWYCFIEFPQWFGVERSN